jgi:hypothetical protein
MDKLTEENNQTANQAPPKRSKVTAISILLIITIITGGTFYFEKFSKKSLVNKQEQILNKKNSKKIEAAPQKSQPKKTEEQKKENIVCNESADFIIDYYQMHLKANQGYDFSMELLNLNKYSIKSEEIKDILNSLVYIAKNNIDDHYFCTNFTSLIKSLYLEDKKSTNIFSHYLNEYFGHLLFIRPIGNRAITLGGFNMNMMLAENALLDNQLEKAEEYIDKLPNKQTKFNEFKHKLKIRIYIKNSLSKIDSIIKIEAKEK